ncbi:MAG: hypothetical protein OXF01_02770 [Gemmatimonadetes bacterium]|nr:hypothetical protein [Gemmatimonadota bacterium]
MVAETARAVLPLAASGIITGASEELVVVHFLGDTPHLTSEGKLRQEHAIIATICLVPAVARALAQQIATVLEPDE